MNNDFLVFDHVTKRFGALTAVNDISLTVKKGEFAICWPTVCAHAPAITTDEPKKAHKLIVKVLAF